MSTKLFTATALLVPSIALVAWGWQNQQSQSADRSATNPSSNMNANQVIGDWPSSAKKAAQETIAKFGQPDGITANMLVWHDKGQYREIIASKEEIQHDFPMPHKDSLEHVVNFKVPADKFDDLAEFDGSVIAERTKGTLAARCDTEAHNLLGLNLAQEVATGKKSSNEARDAFAKAAADEKKGEKPEYLQKLMFEPNKSSADPGKSMQ